MNNNESAMTKWVTKKLGEIAHINRGGSPRPIDAFVTDREDGINWIKIGDIDPDGKYVNSTSERIISEGKCHSREVHKGDFILSNSMSFGRPYILNIDGCIHDGWLAIQDYETYFDTNFLYYLLSSDIVKKQYLSMASGSTVLNLNKEKVARLQIQIPIQADGTPDLAEQRRIAGILSSADGAIAASEALIEKYRNIKRGLLATLLQPKEGWKKVKLGECCEIGDGLHGTPKYDDTGEYYFINGNNIKDGIINIKDDTEKVDEEVYNKHKIALTRETILMSINGTIGNLAYYNDDKVVLGKSVAYFMIQKSIIIDYLYYYLQSCEANNYFDLCLTGSTIKNLGLTQLRDMTVYIPDLAEQHRIAGILSSVDAKIAAEEKVVEKYKGVKKGLMEELLKRD